MKCDTIQTKIITADGPFNENVMTHIKQCDTCRQFADEWKLVRSIDINDDAEPPKSIEFAIKSEAAQFTKKRNSKTVIKFAIFAATAACFAIALLILTRPFTTEQSKTPTIARTTTTTIPAWDSIDMTEDIMEFASNIEVNDVEVLSQLTTTKPQTPSNESSIDDDGFSDDGFSDDDITLTSDSDWLM